VEWHFLNVRTTRFGFFAGKHLLDHSNNLDQEYRCGEVRSRSVAIAALRAERAGLLTSGGISSEETFLLLILTSYLPCVVYAHHFRYLDELVPHTQDAVSKSSCNASPCMESQNGAQWCRLVDDHGSAAFETTCLQSRERAISQQGVVRWSSCCAHIRLSVIWLRQNIKIHWLSRWICFSFSI
jgi:hypothetical protein